MTEVDFCSYFFRNLDPLKENHSRNTMFCSSSPEMSNFGFYSTFSDSAISTLSVQSAGSTSPLSASSNQFGLQASQHQAGPFNSYENDRDSGAVSADIKVANTAKHLQMATEQHQAAQQALLNANRHFEELRAKPPQVTTVSQETVTNLIASLQSSAIPVPSETSRRSAETWSES